MSRLTGSTSNTLEARNSAHPVRDRRGLRPALLFLGLVALFEGVVAVLPRPGALDTFSLGTAALAGALIRASGIPVTVARTDVFIPSRVLVVSLECTGIFVIGALAALVLASPVRPSSKAVGLVLGTIALLVGNLLRLVLVAHLSERAPTLFPAAHDYLFQVALVLLTLSVWAVWMGWARRREA